MRNLNRSLLALPLLLVGAPVLWGANFGEEPSTANPLNQTTDQVEQAEDEHEEGPLGLAMDSMQQGLRALGRHLRTPEGAEESLRAAGSIRMGLIAALSCEPPIPAEITDDVERKRYVVAFHRKLTTVLGNALDLEDALLAGDRGKAAELFRDLRTHKDEGHEQFYPAEEEDH